MVNNFFLILANVKFIKGLCRENQFRWLTSENKIFRMQKTNVEKYILFIEIMIR